MALHTDFSSSMPSGNVTPPVNTGSGSTDNIKNTLTMQLFTQGFDKTMENLYNFQQSEREKSFNANEAEKNRQFQLDMSNTSYQRAVKDMKAAGLNPLLAFQQGGASTPSGSTASSGGYTPSTGAKTSSQKIQDMLSSLLQIGLGFYKVGVTSKAMASRPSPNFTYNIEKYYKK